MKNIVSDVIVGKIYDVVSSRKGNFRIMVTEHSEEWVTGTIIKGKAKAILAYNEAYKGEEITLRRSLTAFYEKTLAN